MVPATAVTLNPNKQTLPTLFGSNSSKVFKWIGRLHCLFMVLLCCVAAGTATGCRSVRQGERIAYLFHQYVVFQLLLHGLVSNHFTMKGEDKV